jgi:hypothetical protein
MPKFDLFYRFCQIINCNYRLQNENNKKANIELLQEHVEEIFKLAQSSRYQFQPNRIVNKKIRKLQY